MILTGSMSDVQPFSVTSTFDPQLELRQLPRSLVDANVTELHPLTSAGTYLIVYLFLTFLLFPLWLARFWL